MSLQTFVGTLDVTDCAVCGMLFGLPNAYHARRRADGAPFFCPSGHSNVYRETETHRLNKALVAERAAKERAEARAAGEARLREQAERRASAARGVITRVKNRVGRGVCPCCRRSFENLQRHMAGQHPSWAGEETP